MSGSSPPHTGNTGASDYQKRVARRLQKLAQDEGIDPSYTMCLDIVTRNLERALDAGHFKREVQAAFLFELENDRLRKSAARKSRGVGGSL